MPVIIRPYIPEFITVHLGAPDTDADNVVVTFPDYIKNVASSEIYPTWNDSAIYANIYAQISYALNKIYTEYYPSRGYSFDITNSAAIDQKFIYGRNIFENINRIVDEIFTTYIRRTGNIEPLAASYCNGTTVTCNGLSQWGSENLAEQGLNSIEILKYYYGDDIELVVNAPIEPLRRSYPGYTLKIGDFGKEVRVIQSELNRISDDYPLIPKIYPMTYSYDESTANSVRIFQEIFNLEPTGEVDRATWYRLVYLYTAVTALSELDSEGQGLIGADFAYPSAIQMGDTGEKVYLTQYLLSIAATFNNQLLPVNIDGIYGENTRKAVIAFQKYNNLTPDGIVGAQTWNTLYETFTGIFRVLDKTTITDSFVTEPFEGIDLKLGSTGRSVFTLQQYLNYIGISIDEIEPILATGIYNRQTRNAVLQFQEFDGLPLTGIVNKETWNAISAEYRNLIASANPKQNQYPGYELSEGV